MNKKKPEGTYIISPYLWVAVDLGNIDRNDVSWDDYVLSITNRGGIHRTHGSV